MYAFSKIILEHTLQITADAIPAERDAQVSACIETIQRYMRWSAEEETTEYYDELRGAICELSGLAFRHGELSIADRLQNIARQLNRPVSNALTTDRSQLEKMKIAIMRLLLG